MRRTPGASSAILLSAIVMTPVTAFALPAFPGAEGFGASATGGRPWLDTSVTPNVMRFPDVFHVTTLDPDPNHLNPHSLTSALYEKNVPIGGRTIVFDVGGTINLAAAASTATLDIKNISHVTIAGQTAPSPITIIGNTTQVTSSSGKTTSNIILQYIDFRRGTGNGNSDALTIHGSGDTRDIMVDHVSGSWSTDEVISVAGATNHANNVTIQNSILSEALQSGHQYGSLIRMNQDASVSYTHNLYSDNASRNPRPGSYLGTTLQFEFQNNVIYNWSDRAGYTGGDGTAVEPVYMNYQGNYLIAGPNTPADSHSTTAFTKDLGDGHPLDLEVYQNDNKIDSNHNATRDGADTGWGMFKVSNGADLPESDKRATPWAYPAAGSADSADVAYAKVVSSVGAFPYSRDTTDTRLINEVLTNTGVAAQSAPNAAEWAAITATGSNPTATRPANFDTDNDGMPNAWELQHALNPSAANNNTLASDGYTHLEHYLQSLTAIANWNLNANGNWSDYLNWRGARPTAADATANFVPGITAPRNVTLDIPATLGVLNFSSPTSYTLAGPATLSLSTFAGRALVTSTAGSHQIDAPVQLQSDTDVQVSAGSTLTLTNVLPTTATLNKLDTGTLRAGPLSLPTLNISAGTVQLLSSAGPSNIPSLTIAAGAQLDLTNNALATNLPADTVRQHLLANRLTSSTPDPNDTLAIGYITSGPTTTAILTALGDANMNGTLDPDDFALLDRSYALATSNAHWTDGDFNYDGVIDQQDFLLIDRTLGQTAGFSPDFLAAREAQFGPDYVSQLLTSVPEPASLTGFLIALPLTRARRVLRLTHR